MNASLACALIALTQNPAPPHEAALDEALSLASLTTGTARFDEGLLRFFRRGEFTSPMYSAASENPWRLPWLMEAKRRELAGFPLRPSDTLNSLGTWTGWGTRRGLIGSPIAGLEKASLEEVMAAYRKRRLIVGRVPDLRSVPEGVRKAAALVLNTALQAEAMRGLAFAEVPDLEATYRRFSRRDGQEEPAEIVARLAIFRKVSLTHLGAGAHDVLLAVQQAQPLLANVPASASYDVGFNTVWGRVRLTGGSATVHPEQDGLLTIDTGGDDRYVGGARNRSSRNWLSVVLDTVGDDRYASHEGSAPTPGADGGRKTRPLTPGPAGALLGYAVQWDASGNDIYVSTDPGLGSGRLGVAALIDASGKDAYLGYADSLGFGTFGLGILEDALGDDLYSGLNQVQGVGQTAGCGVLLDRAGNDRYVAESTPLDFPSPQSDKHNVSMSQGAGNGRRADYLDGQTLAGGIGVLYDLAGDDSYVCGVFGQGVGYWEGVGALWDGAGNDRYESVWYGQGASAHFAIGYLEDEAGDDVYTATMNMAQGAGHDFGVGMLFDRSGNDRYTAPNLSLGAGNANAIGWLLDLGGDDRYASTGWTLGKGADAPVGSLRARALTFGLFMDLGGNDTYPEALAWPRNGARTVNWTAQNRLPGESQLGVFWDR